MTRREELFVEAYANDVFRNQTAAAIKAGYSKKTAASAASRLMKKESVKAAIDSKIDEIHKQNTAQAEEVVEFCTAVMRGEKVDNIPLLAGNGFQKLTKGIPSAKDRLKAAELLGKHYGLFTDRTQIESEGGVIFIPPTDAEG